MTKTKSSFQKVVFDVIPTTSIDDEVISTIVHKFNDHGYVEVLDNDLIDPTIAQKRGTSARKRPYGVEDCVHKYRPARIFPLTREIWFECGMSDSARQVGREINLNPDLFSWIYSNSLVVHELTHFWDLVNLDTCYPLSYVFQLIAWIIAAMASKVGWKAVHESFLMPYRQRVSLSTLLAMHQYSRFWAEARALNEQRLFFEYYSHLPEANTFIEYFKHKEQVGRPCNLLGTCAYHAIASTMIKEMEARFGSLENLNTKIKDLVAVCDFDSVVPLTRTEVLFGDAGLISVAILGIENISFNHENPKTMCQKLNSLLPDYCSVEHKDKVLNDWKKLLHEESEEYLLPIIKGRIHDALMSMVSVRNSGREQTCNKLMVSEEKWGALRTEERQLCIDLFKLRMNLFSGMEYDEVHNCTSCLNKDLAKRRTAKCPILKLMEDRKLTLFPDIMRSVAVKIAPPANNRMILCSDVSDTLEKHFRNNRTAYK